MSYSTSSAYTRAKEKVQKIKRFYKHLTAYIIINSAFVILGLRGIDVLSAASADLDPKFMEWLFWNVLGVPFLWGIGLLIHAVWLFGPGFGWFENWEKRQLRKYLNEQD
jgi:hypothetical protein